MILSEIADCGFVSPNYFSCGEKRPAITAGSAEFGFRNRWRVRQQGMQERRFTSSVSAHQGDFLAAHNACGNASNDFEIAV